MIDGATKIPEPIIDPTTIVVASNSPRRCGRRAVEVKRYSDNKRGRQITWNGNTQ
jgi:hypothetical protein